MTEAAEKYFNRLYPDGEFKFASTDPEFAEFFANFSCDEVVNQDDLDDRTRMMAILAALLGCQGIDEFREVLPGGGKRDRLSGMCLSRNRESAPVL